MIPGIVEIFATNLRGLRQAKGLTLTELARRVGYSERYLEIMERGEVDPTINTMAELAAALGVKATQLLAPVLVK